jgi:hypothetical protein
MKKCATFFIAVSLIITASCSNKESNNDQKFKIDEKNLTESLGMILKANLDARKGLSEFKKSFKDSSEFSTPTDVQREAYFDLINKNLKSDTSIILQGQKVSNSFLNYISPEFKTKYRNLIDNYTTTIEVTKQNLSADSLREFDIKTQTIESAFWDYLQEHQSEFNQKLPEFKDDFKASMVKYNLPVGNNKEIEKFYWGLFWRLSIGGFVVTLIFSFVIVIIVFLIASILKISERSKKEFLNVILVIPVSTVGFVAQAYLWILWSGFCVYSVKFFIDSPTVTQSWIYYITGFFASWLPLSYMASKEIETANSTKERNGTVVGSTMYILISILSFLVFSFFPTLMQHDFISFFYKWVY